MFRAMAWKEFRDIRRVAVVALILYGAITLSVIEPRSPLNLLRYLGLSGSSYDDTPFIRDSFVGKYYFFAVLVAIAFGLMQTFGETVRGTYPFLLHRSASLRWLMGMKLFIGATVYMLATLIPLVVYCFWAASPGNHASPFEWSMTTGTWGTWFALSMVYFGTFLTGILPGSWYQARFLPLAASIMVLIVVGGFSNVYSVGLLRPCLIVVVVDAWLIAAIFFVARSRDYS